MEKTEARALGLKKRGEISEEDRALKSQKIADLLESTEPFQNARNILCYYSHHAEVATLDLMEKWLDKKNFYLPRLTEENSFVAMPFSSLEALEPNQFGIPEPVSTVVDIPAMDLIIVPGVVFDRKGNRIGMGKGYYDRFLEDKLKVPKIGLAYSEQVLESVAKDPYDVAVDFIVTENEVIRC